MSLKIIWKVAKKMMKSVIITAIVLVVSIAISTVDQATGIILMMLYSAWKVIKSSRKEMPLNKFTALLPGIISIVTFFIMLGLLGVKDDSMPLIGIGLGIIPGWLMARGHNIYKKNGIVYAKRTFFYILIWATSMLFTQGSGLAGLRDITDFGLLLNGFSMAMMVVLSIFLFKKYLNKHPSSVSSKNNLILFILLFLFIPHFVSAQSNIIQGETESELVNKGGKYVFKDEKSIFPSGKYYFHDNKSGPSYLRQKFSHYYFEKDPHYGGYSILHLYRNNSNTSQFDFFSKINSKVNKNDCNVSSGSFGNGGKGIYCIKKMHPGTEDEVIIANAVWKNNEWIFTFNYVDDVNNNKATLMGSNAMNYIQGVLNRIPQRINNLQISNIPTQVPSTNSNSTDSQESNQQEFTPNSNYQSYSNSDFSEDELAASGILVALIMLLASLGLNSSVLAAQELANSLMTATQETTVDNNAPLIDPYDGVELHEEEGMYWAGREGDEGKWMTREEAEKYLAGLREQKSKADEFPSILDPYTGKPFETDGEGNYWAPDENGKWRWLNKKETKDAAIDLQNEADKKDTEFNTFNEETDQLTDQRYAVREQQLREDGFVFDEDQQAWVKNPSYSLTATSDEPRSDLEEFYDRLDYVEDSIVKNLENNSEGLTKEQIENTENILDRIRKNHNKNPNEVSKDDLADIRRLNVAINNIRSGASQAEYADAQYTTDVLDNPVIKYGEKSADVLIFAGRMSAHLLEATFSPYTRGAITGFVYGFAESSDKSFSDALYNASVTATSSWVDNKVGSLLRGNISWNSVVGGTTAAIETALKGGSYEDIKNAFGTGALFGGIFEGSQNLKETGSVFGNMTPKTSIDISGRTSNDIHLDMDYHQNKLEASRRVTLFENSVKSGDSKAIRNATIEILEDRGSKLAMKSNGVSNDLKKVFADATYEHRTKPVFEGTAKVLNDQNKYFVLENGVKRPVKMEDLTTGSGTSGKAPGVDFDMYAQKDIIDSTTGKSIKPDDLTKVVNKVTRDLGINPKATETNVMHKYHEEAYPIGPDQSPKELLENASNWNKNEGSMGKNISDGKAADADIIHGSNSANSISEKCRGAMKDYERITTHMAKTNSKVKIPELFTKIDSKSNKSVLNILDDVGKGKLAPGTGNFQIRKITGGKTIEEVSKILNSLQEAIPVLKSI